MDEFIDSNHTAELVIVQNMNKLYEAITNVEENYTLAWHNDHSHSIVGLRARNIIDTSWSKATQNIRSIYVEDQHIKVEFSRKHLPITMVEDFSLYSLYLMAETDCYVGASVHVWNDIYKDYRQELGMLTFIIIF